jgi:hypothetical protein
VNERREATNLILLRVILGLHLPFLLGLNLVLFLLERSKNPGENGWALGPVLLLGRSLSLGKK